MNESILKELIKLRRNSKITTGIKAGCVKSRGSSSLVLQTSSGIINYDYASLYPRAIQPFDKNFIRRIKIRKILQAI